MAETAIGSTLIIISCIVGALFALGVLRHYWPPSTRIAHNDVVGPNVSVIGTTYAVLIAFMLLPLSPCWIGCPLVSETAR